MTIKHSKFLGLVLSLVLLSNQSSSQNSPIKEIGIDNNQFGYFASEQQKDMWCWAASIQMIFRYNRVYKNQKQIVERVYGTDMYGDAPNFGGTSQDISNSLNNWGYNTSNEIYTAHSNYYNHKPSPDVIVGFLSKRQPILISYISGPNMLHAVVVTGCRYYDGTNGPVITQITVRDPWPSQENIDNNGVVTYDFPSFYNSIVDYWDVSIIYDKEQFIRISDIRNSSNSFCNVLLKALEGFDNNFESIKGDGFDDTQEFYYSTLRFPNEIRKGTTIYTGEFPTFSDRFYKGNSEDSANIAYSNLKSEFSCIGAIPEESIQNFPTDSRGRDVNTKSIVFHLDNNLIITLYLHHLRNDRNKRYQVNFEIKPSSMDF